MLYYFFFFFKMALSEIALEEFKEERFQNLYN